MNSAGGPWAFWIEMKGTDTPVKITKAQKEAGRTGDQPRWWYRRMAAGVPVFCLRNRVEIIDVLDLVGFPHGFTFKDVTETGSGRPMRMLIGEGWMWPVRERETEHEAQTGVKDILTRLGFNVLDTSQGFRPGRKNHGTTRMELGTPDLYCTAPGGAFTLAPDESIGLRDRSTPTGGTQ